ncbi:MAG: hypothetical protein EXR43_05575 [Dehalococcoidia bacterium]|nr:hypothetical protein [Dehalococcoidia bacterium]
MAAGGHLHVIGDDELELLIYAVDGSGPAQRLPLFPDRVSRGRQSKAVKPDLETLVLLLPPAGLLALGSGSSPNRRRGAWIPAGVHGPVYPVDLSDLYAALPFLEVNIEGAAVTGETLRLLQRGNGRARENAVVDLRLEPFLAALLGRLPLPAAIHKVHLVDLGNKGGVAWSFTDASPLPDGRTLFSAAAEDTSDPYEDGPCTGAALGILARDGTLAAFEEIDLLWKIEGIHAFPSGDAFLVADMDDPHTSAPLLIARWSELG